ncbi:MAG: MG2 domain-containing protein, partial [Bryobacteraceae bacterium]
MKAQNGLKNIGKYWLYFLAAFLLIGCAAMIELFEQARAASGDSLSATYSHGTLRLTIPYKAPHKGSGRLTVDVLNPEDEILDHSEQTVSAGDGSGAWHIDLKIAKAIKVEDLVWHRLRYRFEFRNQKQPAIESTESLSTILRTPVLRVIGQQSYLTGGPAAIRVIATDTRNEMIPGPGSVLIELLAPNRKPRMLFTGALNDRGTAQADFHFPAGLAGAYSLRYVVETAIGAAEYTQAVRLEEKVSILLTTEKPLYQPGQTIHVRALTLDRSNHQAVAGRKLTFELEDSRGNKVFKKVTQTSKFGIASAEFGLADEVNLGAYHLRAVMGEADAGPQSTAQAVLNVERYVLPKFKVAVEFSGQTKHGYRPGDRVTGIVRASYFFGKPVEGAEISVKASAMDVEQFEAGAMKGKTDSEGSYHFDLKLAGYFAGRALNHGAAQVLIEATVKDSAGHAETRGQPITVSPSPLIVTAVPEGGTLIPNLENQLFILTSYADGQPAPATVTVRTPGNADQNIRTDAGGVGVIRVKVSEGTTTLAIEAKDQDGNHTSVSVPLSARSGEDQILLRTEHAVYHAGDRIALKVLSTKQQGTAYVDVVREGQTVLTRDVDIVNGTAELALTATPEMAGTLDFSAYLFGRDARPVGDHRLIFVQPAGELKIEATADGKVYKPGDDARIRLHVTNSRGEGVQAALGLQVVDEAVFALAEKQPGFAKVFFYLQQEAMKPRYEIHSIGMSDIVEPVEAAQADHRDRAARALFASTEMVRSNKFETEAGRVTTQAKWGEYYSRYQVRFQSQVVQLARELSRAYAANPSGGDLTKVIAQMTPQVRDSWSTPLRIQSVPWDAQKKHYIVTNAGPDQRFDSGDEMTAYVELRTAKKAGTTASGAIAVAMEHDRGPMNAQAEITGFIFDHTRASIPGATVTAREIRTGKLRRAAANATGEFRLSAVPPGSYDLQVQSAGFRSASTRVSVEVRDRAIVTATLAGNDVSESVVVLLLPEKNKDFGRLEARDAVAFRAGMGGGFAGGVIGGIAGGVPAGARLLAPLRMANAMVSAGAIKKEYDAAPAARV